jgi:DNA-binding NtrC family response regulator
MPGKETIRVLITDNNIQLVEELKDQLAVQGRGMGVMVRSCITDVVWQLDIESFDVVVLDIRFSRYKDVSLLVKLKQVNPELEVIVYSNFATADTAIMFLKQGAYDFLTKPCSSRKLARIILNANEKIREQERQAIVKKCHKISYAADHIIGECEEIRKIREHALTLLRRK